METKAFHFTFYTAPKVDAPNGYTSEGGFARSFAHNCRDGISKQPLAKAIIDSLVPIAPDAPPGGWDQSRLFFSAVCRHRWSKHFEQVEQIFGYTDRIPEPGESPLSVGAIKLFITHHSLSSIVEVAASKSGNVRSVECSNSSHVVMFHDRAPVSGSIINTDVARCAQHLAAAESFEELKSFGSNEPTVINTVGVISPGLGTIPTEELNPVEFSNKLFRLVDEVTDLDLDSSADLEKPFSTMSERSNAPTPVVLLGPSIKLIIETTGVQQRGYITIDELRNTNASYEIVRPCEIIEELILRQVTSPIDDLPETYMGDAKKVMHLVSMALLSIEDKYLIRRIDFTRSSEGKVTVRTHVGSELVDLSSEGVLDDECGYEKVTAAYLEPVIEAALNQVLETFDISFSFSVQYISKAVVRFFFTIGDEPEVTYTLPLYAMGQLHHLTDTREEGVRFINEIGDVVSFHINNQSMGKAVDELKGVVRSWPNPNQ